MNLDRQSRLYLLLSLVLLGMTLALYWPSLDCDFVNYDDHQYVVGNSHVHTGLTPETCRWAFNIGYACNWHPLTWLSHMADCQIFGVSPRGHHLTNLLFHLMNTLLLFGVLRRMTSALWSSFWVAALFACHPLHVESIAWVAERKDLLSTFFFLLTLWAYHSYVQRSKVQSPKCKVWYAVALLLFALGLMSKPMLVTLPFVLLLLDYWPLERLQKKATHAGRNRLGALLLEKTPFFALSLGSCVITLIAQERGGAVVPLRVIPFDARGWNALVSCLRYAEKLFWPSDLAVIYPYVYHWPVWRVALAAAFLLTVTTLAVALRRREPYILVGWFWFLGTLVPVIGLVQVGEQAIADRYTYIPSIGILVLSAWAIQQWIGRRPTWRPTCLVAGALVLAACAAMTHSQLCYWRNGVALFRHTLAVTKDNPVAHATLGLALMDEGKLDDAVAEYQSALSLSPDYSLAHNNLGVALARLARFGEAIVHYEAALQLNPGDPEAHFNLANALNPGFVDTHAFANSATNRPADIPRSREHYQEALQLFPKYSVALINWGNLELTAGDPAAAIGHYQDAIRIDPLAALAHLNLGNALAKTGRTNEAIRAYARAIEIEPGDSLARMRLANLFASQGEFDKAIPVYQQVLKLDPQHFVARSNLGSALARLGQYQEASRCFTEVIRTHPNYPDAHANLGKYLEIQGETQQAAEQYSEAARLDPENPDLHRKAALLLAQEGRFTDAIAHFSAMARLRPQDPAAQYDLALALVKSGESQIAVQHLRSALRLEPDWVQAINNLAWILATNAKEQVRNGPEAVQLATRACALTGYKEPNVVGTLDAAYAEAGRFPEAMETARKTCELAKAAGKPELARKARERLKLYQAGTPFHERGDSGESP